MKGFITGVKMHPWQALISTFAAFSVMWTLTESFTYFIPTLNLRGAGSLASVLLLSVIWALVNVRQPSRVQISVKNSTTMIEVKFGDLFAQGGYRAIAVSEFFESQLGQPVSERSIHGIFLQKCFGGHAESFDKIIESELRGIVPQRVNKTIGKVEKYPIGTTALVPVNDDRYLCFVLCETDPQTCKVSAEVPMLWRALEGLWQKARTSLGGAAVVLPLVGSGVSGIGLSARELLDLLILSAVTETKRRKITDRIRIVLTLDRFDEIDLKEVRRYWS